MAFQVAVPTKNEVMYHALRQGLLAGTIKPGQRLVISNLAEKHSVSPIPVREAIRRLQQEGFVEVVPYIGAIVTSINFSTYKEMVEVRNQLEVMAAMSATERMTTAGIKRLESMLVKMGKLVGFVGMREFMNLDRKFHFGIYEFSPNEFLIESVVTLWDRCNISKYVFAWDSVRAPESLAEHEEILEAVKNKQMLRVGELIREHKEHSFERLRVALCSRKSPENI